MPKPVQRTRIKGQPGLPPGSVYVGRGPGSKYGNPFRAYDSSPGERRIATLLFANLLRVRAHHPATEHLVAYPSLDEIRTDLAGKDLACWCPLPEPGQPDWCHRSILLRVAAGEPI